MNIPENQIQAIIKILEEEESCLSDSYGYYCNRDTKLREIAIEIITQLDIIKKWEYTVGLIGGHK